MRTELAENSETSENTGSLLAEEQRGTAQTEDYGICALEGCENPLSPPAIDEEGRRKGGRPSSYCGKTHADAASRARRIAQTAAIVDPLNEIQRIIEGFTSTAQPLLTAVDQMKAQLGTAEKGALAQVQEAQEQTRLAKAEAEEASKRAEQAGRAQAQAIRQSHEDRAAKEAAEKAIERASHDAEQIKKESWARVVDHERARGAAEAAHKAATQAQEELAAALREARSQIEDGRKTQTDLQRTREILSGQLNELKTENAVTSDRLRAAEKQTAITEESARRANQELADARAVETSLRTELADARQQLSHEHTAHQLAKAQVESTQQNIDAVKADLGDAHARLDQVLSMHAATVKAAETAKSAEANQKPMGSTEV